LKSKTLAYLGIIVIGVFLSFFIPFVETVGVGASIFFMAVFLPYFGRVGMLKIHTVIWLFVLLINTPAFIQSVTVLTEIIPQVQQFKYANGTSIFQPEQMKSLAFLGNYYFWYPILLLATYAERYCGILIFSRIIRKNMIVRNLQL